MTATLSQQVAAGYTGGDTRIVATEVRDIIDAAITNAPRSLQTTIGPSEIGMDCTRCLVHKLAGTPEERDAAWLPTVGTAVHAWLEQTIVDYECRNAKAGLPFRFLPECRLHVGDIGGGQIHGSCDLFDVSTGTVIDYKIVGVSTLRSAKANGASEQYRVQQHLYGKGWEDAGYTVQAVSVWYLPRNEPHLGNAIFWQEPYDRSVAVAALAKANTLAGLITSIGVDAVLATVPAHTGGFSCKRMPDADVWSKLSHPTNSGGTMPPAA